MDSRAPSSSTRPPNVLVIMTDQHRHSLMTCAGSDVVPTPNIDRIAARGVRFTNAVCPYPVCVASRMAMLTGNYAHTTGAINNTDRLDWRYRTMAHHFAENGYLTGLVGKMHFNDVHNHGFDYYMSINDWLMYLGPKVQHFANEIGNHPLSSHFFRTMLDDGAGMPDVADLWDGPSPWVGSVDAFDFETLPCMASALESKDHLDMFIARESGRFLRRYVDQPFFLVTSIMKPHTPFYAPREWAEKYPTDAMTLPETGDISSYPPHIQRRIENHLRIPERHRRAALAGYMANLAFADHCVGAVLDALEEAGLSDNTIVVYTSDHGEMNGDHGLFQKFCLFDPSVRVPLIVSQPGVLGEGSVTLALTELIGLYPTLADLAGLPAPTETSVVSFPGAPDGIDAASFADLARDPSLPGPEAVFSEYALRSGLPQYMVRTHRHKFVYNHGSMHELYDLADDPGETRNLIHDANTQPVVKELTDRLFSWYDPESNPWRPSGD